MSKIKLETLKRYVESITEEDGMIVKEMILNHLEYLEVIDDDGNPIKQ